MQSCGISVVHVAESGVHLVYKTECILHKGHEPLVILHLHYGGILQLTECANLVLSILALVQGPLLTLMQFGSIEAGRIHNNYEVSQAEFSETVARLLCLPSPCCKPRLG